MARAVDNSRLDLNRPLGLMGVKSVCPSMRKTHETFLGIRWAISVSAAEKAFSSCLPLLLMLAEPKSNKISEEKINRSPTMRISLRSCRAFFNSPKNTERASDSLCISFNKVASSWADMSDN